MPELPEVENVVRGLQSRLTGKRILGVQIRNASIVKHGLRKIRRGLAGQSILRIARCGKYIVVDLESGCLLAFHLGMSGRLYFASDSTPFEKHTHLVIRIAGEVCSLRHCDARRFGGAYFFDRRDGCTERLERLGPDPLEMEPESFYRVIGNRRCRLKSLLMNQRVVSGLGNIYIDESLHRTGIHPEQPAYLLGKRKVYRLLQNIRDILEAAIESGGSTISDYVDTLGYRGQYQNYYRVYGRETLPCLTPGCDATIRRILVAGRSSHFCPRCQRLRQPKRRQHQRTR